MVSRHCHWRTVQEWDRLNVPLSTASDEASKMYDATLTQMMAHWDDPGVGGVMSSVQAMLEADPDFVVGQSLSLNLQLFGAKVTPDTDPDLRHALDRLQKQVESQDQLRSGERKHAQAVQLLADGDMHGASQLWESILVDHPHDLLALKMAYITHIYTGNSTQLRDSLARVLPHWSPQIPHYGYVLGMHAFGLEECNMFQQAEKQAAKALAINERDAWATHSLSHVFDMTGQQQRGIDFLDSTVHNWSPCEHLACHNWWHLALHYVELGNFDAALDIFEKQVKSLCMKRGEMFALTDAAGLLFRLEMQGVNTDRQWQGLAEVADPYLHKHRSAYNDLHLVMTSLGVGDISGAQAMLDSVERFVREGKGTTQQVHGAVGLALCQAMMAYKEGDFARAVHLVYPLRYQFYTIGGSHAQRDVFHQFLIMSAVQSSDKHHHKLAGVLLAERKARKDSSPLTEGLLARVMALDIE